MQPARICWRRSAALALILALVVPILAACGGGAPAATEQPTAGAAEAPTAAAAQPTVSPADLIGGLTETNGLAVASVKACDAKFQGAAYGGLIKEIAAVDKTTVRLTM